MNNLLFVLVFFHCLSLHAQCDNNLIKNGSFELDSIGSPKFATFWDFRSGSSDIENADDDFSELGLEWGQTPLSSNDGGNWCNIGHFDNNGDPKNEIVGQTVFLTSSLPHRLEFEFTAQIMGTDQFDLTGYAAIDVFINGELIYTTPLDTTLFTWEKVSITFIPNQNENLIHFRINPDIEVERVRYVAIDGVCLRPVRTGMFCEP